MESQMNQKQIAIQVYSNEFDETNFLVGGCRSCMHPASVVPSLDQETMKVLPETECMNCDQVYVISDHKKMQTMVEEVGDLDFMEDEEEDDEFGSSWRPGQDE